MRFIFNFKKKTAFLFFFSYFFLSTVAHPELGHNQKGRKLLVLKIKPYIKIYESNGIRIQDFIDDLEVEKQIAEGDFSFYESLIRYEKSASLSEGELISLWKSFKSSHFLNFPKVRKKRVFLFVDFKKYLDRFQMEWAKRKGSKTLVSLIQWVIPDRVTVENRGFEISRDSIKAHLINRWQKQCEDCEFSFLSLSSPEVKSFLQGKPWKIVFPSRLPQNFFSLPLHFVNFKKKNQGFVHEDLSPEDWIKKLESQKTYWIQGRVEIYKKVPVLNRDFGVNQRIEEGDFDFSFRKIHFFSERKLPLRGEILGKKLRLSLKAGEILWKSSFLKERAVKKGDQVKIKMDKKSWSVVLTGKAIEEGMVGDQIKVLNLSSRKVIPARVVRQGEVWVQ